jgi:hypothetical protein
MKVCGFTFIRNAVKFDYPVVEAISSILPLCDQFIVIVGNSEDNTKNIIERIDPTKIKIVDSIWNDSLRKGGEVLAQETNKAIDLLPEDFNWAFYIQADEILHEKYHTPVHAAMEKWKDDLSVEGLLFEYLHFYGSYDFVGDSTRWYRNEIRIIRCDKSIRSFRDAQGFRKDDRLLNVRKSDGCIYHYGWVKTPMHQQEKQKYFHSLWHSDEWLKKNIPMIMEFDYTQIDSLIPFLDSHPAVMENRIAKKNWPFHYDPSMKNLSMKSRLKSLVENLTGWRPGEYKNYRLIK